MGKHSQAAIEIEDSLRFLTIYQGMLGEKHLQVLRRIINNATRKEEMSKMRRHLENKG